jgi:ABC-type amino acid transport substrate-binding protein
MFSVLLDAGLEPGERTRRFSNEVATGRVIRTDPRAGTVVQRGTSVDYVLSRGPEPTPSPVPTPNPTQVVVTVPDVRGDTVQDAVNAILDAGLRPGEQFRRFNRSIPEGRVIRTDPASGVRVAEGAVVDLFVSRGPQPIAPTSTPPQPTPRPTAATVAVPDVRGDSEQDAVTALLDAGLRPGERFRRFNDSIPQGRVIRTDPAAGVQVEQGTAVDYYLSRGPRPSAPPEPTAVPTVPPPTSLPEPSAVPGTPVPTPLPGDLLSRIQAAGVLRVNVDPHNAPWSVLRSDGSFEGYDVRVARQIADRLGVAVEFTTFPLQEVVVGTWNGRWDIAMEHLAITDARRQVLDFTQPYAWDPSQVAATNESGVTDYQGLAGAPICVASLSSELAWLSGALGTANLPGPPALPPDGATPAPVSLDQRCRNQVGNGSPPFSGWVSSLVSINDAVADGVPVTPVGDPVFFQPIGVAFDRSVGDHASALSAVDAIIGQLRADGTLTGLSTARFAGLDLSQPPGGVAPGAPVAAAGPAFSADPDLQSQVPITIGGQPVATVALSGADLETLLVPANRDVQRTWPSLVNLVIASGTDLSSLALVLGSVAGPDGTGSLLAARLPGTSSGDLEGAITPLATSQYSDPVAAPARVQGKSVTRVSDGPFESGESATYLYQSGDVVFAIQAAPPVLGQIMRELP